jgi:hypothetical protein
LLSEYDLASEYIPRHGMLLKPALPVIVNIEKGILRYVLGLLGEF